MTNTKIVQETGRDTVERLRSDIDRGRTGEKIDWPDPAAAPLGVDEEAAGTPVPGEGIAMARAHEMQGPTTRDNPRRGLGAAWILIAVIVLFVVVAGAAGFIATRS